jgi:hypothetical protein
MKSLRCLLLLLWLAAWPAVAQQLALPATSTALTSPEGQKLLEESQRKAAFFPLAAHAQTQVNGAFCGPASCVMVLNSLGGPAPASEGHSPYHYYDQSNFFTPATEQVLPRETLLHQGATLEQLAGMLRAHGTKAQAVHAEPGGLDAFRQQAREAVGRGDIYVIVNFVRQPLNQEGSGHFCPLAAYHERTDQFLVMDVARYKYPPFWVKAADLFGAMSTFDKDAQANRGYLLIAR